MTLTKRTLTTGEVEGSGIFDELMRTVKAHVHLELSEGRITEQNYSQVYLGALQSVLQTAIQFTLQMEVINKQLLVADEQIIQSKKQNEISELERLALITSNAAAQYNLDFMLPQQLALVTKQNTQVTAQTALTAAQTIQSTAQKDLIVKQEDLVDEQILAAVGQYTDATEGLIGKEQAKIDSEIAILTEKALTEKAQTQGEFYDVNNNPSGVQGLIGAELRLKNTQKDSFLRDAEQKVAKMYTDVFATLYATDPNDPYSLPENYGFDISTSRDVMDQLLAGIGATRSDENNTLGGTGVGVDVPLTGPAGSLAPITYPREFPDEA